MISITDETAVELEKVRQFAGANKSYASLAAAHAVLSIYQRNDIPAAIHRVGLGLLSCLVGIGEQLADHGVCAKGIPEMCFLEFSSPRMSAMFASAAAQRRVIFKRNAYNFVSHAHSDENISEIVSRLQETAEEVKQNC